MASLPQNQFQQFLQQPPSQTQQQSKSFRDMYNSNVDGQIFNSGPWRRNSMCRRWYSRPVRIRRIPPPALSSAASIPLLLHPMHIQSQGNVTALNCPAPGCAGLLEPHQCRTILPKEVFERWCDALCEAAVILGAERFYCPYKDSSTPEIRPHSTMAASSLAASKLLNIRTSPIKAASAALLSPSVQYTR